MFGRWAHQGQLVVTGNGVLVTSRSFTWDPQAQPELPSSRATLGQGVPGVAFADAVQGRAEARLIMLGGEGTRSNIGVANLREWPLYVTVRLLDGEGRALGWADAWLPSLGHGQLNGVLDGEMAPGGDATAIVVASEPEARYLVYASVIDEASADPFFILPTEAAPGPVIVPAAAHANGNSGVVWRTDLLMAGHGPAEATYRLELLTEDGLAEVSTELVVGAGQSVRFHDVVEAELGAFATGALRLTPLSDVTAVITSRTFTESVAGTLGQHIPALALAEAAGATQEVRLVGLPHSPGGDRGFRTNLGLVNLTGQAVDLEVLLLAADGAQLWQRSTTLVAWSHHQDNDVLTGTGDELPATAVVRTTTPGGRFIAYASVVDNRSGDPTYIPGIVLAGKTTHGNLVAREDVR